MKGRAGFEAAEGVTLLITLVFIVLICIIVVGLAETMRLERQIANSYFERTRAGQLAQEGVDDVVALLRQSTGDTNRYWITQPGQLVVGAPEDDPSTTVDERKALKNVVPLSSGIGTFGGSSSLLQPANLNITTLRDPTTYLITNDKGADGKVVQMLLNWIYVRADGTLDTSQTPDLSNKANPIRGRFAYWTDDESSKINYNLAWGRNTTPANTNSSGYPTKIDLTALPGMNQSMANTLHTFISSDINYASLNNGFFNTPSDARRVAANIASVLQTNEFEVTHYNHDPNTTFFNQPRIVLTTQQKNAGTSPFLDILLNENTDPGTITNPNGTVNIDVTKLNSTLTNLVTYLSRTDWPMAAGSSFQAKYYNNNPTRLAQLAVNLIDYVRSKESINPLVEPLRVEYAPATGTFTLGAGTGHTGSYDTNSFFGIARTPYVTEMGVWVAPTGTSTSTTTVYNMTGQIELYLPPNYGLTSVDLTKLSTTLDVFPYKNATTGWGVTAGFAEAPITASQILGGGGTTLSAGKYVTITRSGGSFSLPQANAPRPPALKLRAALSIYTATLYESRLDVVPQLFPNSINYVSYTVDTTTVIDPAKITSAEVDDPRVNKNLSNWVMNVPGIDTFNNTNTLYSVGKTPGSYTPQQDTDASGLISAASLYMPPPAGATFTRADGSVDNNKAGMVNSAGELGYISTGVEGVTAPGYSGTPWRTLRLQPNSQASSVVPDWAFLDLFTAPVNISTNASYVFQPHVNAIGGRVNINSQAFPFTNLVRTIPLAAVLQGCTYDSTSPISTLSAAQAQVLAANIYDRTLATNGKFYGGYTNGYVSPAEVVEIQGIADGGEQSEELVRQVSNLLTARGEVFTIYSVGQAVMQTSLGSLKITAEQRLQVMVERYLDPTTGQVRFAPVYTRGLTP